MRHIIDKIQNIIKNITEAPGLELENIAKYVAETKVNLINIWKEIKISGRKIVSLINSNVGGSSGSISNVAGDSNGGGSSGSNRNSIIVVRFLIMKSGMQFAQHYAFSCWHPLILLVF